MIWLLWYEANDSDCDYSSEWKEKDWVQLRKSAAAAATDSRRQHYFRFLLHGGRNRMEDDAVLIKSFSGIYSMGNPIIWKIIEVKDLG